MKSGPREGPPTPCGGGGDKKAPVPSHTWAPEVKKTTWSTHFVLRVILASIPDSRWTGCVGEVRGWASTLSWSSHVILWGIPWLPSSDMDPGVGGSLLPLQEPWLPGFL